MHVASSFCPPFHFPSFFNVYYYIVFVRDTKSYFLSKLSFPARIKVKYKRVFNYVSSQKGQLNLTLATTGNVKYSHKIKGN